MQIKSSRNSESSLLRLERQVRALPVPGTWRRRIVSAAAGWVVPFVGTGSVDFNTVSKERALLSMRNRRKVQNHMKTVHASAMFLLAETATGTVLNCNLPDGSRYAVIHADIVYKQKAQGEISACAELNREEQAQLGEPSGQLSISARITDARGVEAAVCTITWSWKHPAQG